MAPERCFILRAARHRQDLLNSFDLTQLQDCLRPLAFDIREDEKHINPAPVQKYLDHFKINFSRRIPGVRHGLGTFKSGEFTIAAHYWLADPAAGESRGTAFVVHGYFDHTGLYHHLIRFLLQNSYSVVVFDLPGMGLSSGERASIESFTAYYRAMLTCCEHFHRVVPEPWFAIGQSTGCAGLLRHLLTEGPEPFSKTVLLAPLVRSKGWVRDRWLYLAGKYWMDSIPRVFTANSHDPEFLAFLREEDPLQARHLPIKWVGAMKEWIDLFATYPPQPHPVLVVQGDEDSTVDWKHNLEQIQLKLPNAKIRMIHRARHHLVAESAPYRAQVFAAIKTYLEKPE
ncbi:alpha/beta hydrolase [Proteobacteria bacterium 005FR1]|nr:alpha/beta hydrolase [Proteobacteria bacterium 005FR1]